MGMVHLLGLLGDSDERHEERQKDRLIRRLARETSKAPMWWIENKTIFPKENIELPRYETVEDLTTELQKPPMPFAFSPQVNHNFLEEYQKIANDIGYHPVKLMQEKIKAFFLENNVLIYSYLEVDEYLTYLADQQKQWWIWRPLREKDSQCPFLLLGHNRDFSVTNSPSFHHGSYSKKINYFSYKELVPISILTLIKEIEDSFDKDLKFFVSDCFAHNSTRFIMICKLKSEPIIFGAWDGSMLNEDFLK